MDYYWLIKFCFIDTKLIKQFYHNMLLGKRKTSNNKLLVG